MFTIYKRELRALYLGYRGYAFTAIFAVLYCVVRMVYNYFNSYALTLGYFNAEYMLTFLPVAFALAVPVITFSVYEKERKEDAYTFLRSLPIKASSVTAGKYLALLTSFIVPYAVLTAIDFILGTYSGAAVATVALSLLSYVLICNAFLAISFFCATMLRNKFAALGVSYGISLGCVGLYALSQLLPVGMWREMLLKVSLVGTYTSVVFGRFDITALILWLRIGAAFLWLSFAASKKEMFE